MKKLAALLLLFLASAAQAEIYNPPAAGGGGTTPIASGGTGATTAAGARTNLFPMRLIASGTTDTATSADYYIRWNSASLSAKSQVLPTCSGGLGAATIIVIDGVGNAGTYAINISVASGTIQKASGVPAVLSSPFGSMTFVCDGVSDWSIL